MSTPPAILRLTGLSLLHVFSKTERLEQAFSGFRWSGIIAQMCEALTRSKTAIHRNFSRLEHAYKKTQKGMRESSRERRLHK
jgi:hypothetical protein